MSEQKETNDGVDDVFDGGPGMDWDNNEKLREEKMQTNEKARGETPKADSPATGSMICA